jgi:peroxiredoxin
MIHVLRNRFSLRSVVPAVLSVAMLLSLTCSMSISSAHAEMSIADSAQDVTPVQVGQVAPQFDVKTVDDEVFSFDPANLERPAMLVTFRGGWCPFCNMHLSELRTVIPEINAMGVDVLFLSGDRPEMLYASLKMETQEAIDGLDYTILSDADANAAIALGVAFKINDSTIERRNMKGDDIEDSSMTTHGSLPVPAIFAIGTDGVISFAYVNADYKVRLPSDDVLQAAKDLVD